MMRTGRTWKKFEETRGVTIAGRWDALREIAGMKDKGRGEGREGGKGYAKFESKTVKGAGKKDSGKSAGFKGEQKCLGISRTVLDMWQDWRQVVGMSMGS